MKREAWEELQRSLTWPGASAKVQCDGYVVTLQVQRDKMRMVIAVFVGGWMRGEWLMNDCEERQRFMRPTVRRPKPYTAKQIRVLGKKWCDEQIAKRTFTWYGCLWPSIPVLRRHFEKHNTSVELYVATAGADA